MRDQQSSVTAVAPSEGFPSKSKTFLGPQPRIHEHLSYRANRLRCRCEILLLVPQFTFLRKIQLKLLGTVRLSRFRLQIVTFAPSSARRRIFMSPVAPFCTSIPIIFA